MADDQKDFLATARKRFAQAAEDEKELRAKFVDDLKFASPDGDDQWDPKLKQQREIAGRPAMVFPRGHIYVAQVANEARQKKPQIKFAPRLDADKDTAEIYEGLARYIQYASDAQIAYDTAIEYSAGGSFGYYRFLTDYCDEDSDDLDLILKPVLDPLTIYGILCPAIFGRKPKYAFVVEEMPKDEFKAQYPKSELSSLSWDDAQREYVGWVGSETVRIAEYWYCEPIAGSKREKYKVKFCKTNGFEILPDSQTDWPGSCIPIIPVLGKQMIIEGKPRLSSVVRPQKDAQKMINYGKSRIAETLSYSPISPFIAAKGQIAGFESQWETLNNKPRPVLEYNPVDVNGQPVGPPQRQVAEAPIQALSAFMQQEIDDMKATTGIFDASLGNTGNETSGQAIARRQEQTNLTTMHFMDNLVRSFKEGGEIIAELIPKIYDTAREVQILGEDEKPKLVLINKKHQDEAGKPVHYDMTKGKYALIVTSGKAFDSKRSETFDTMQQVLQTNPDLMNVVGDIYFRNSDLAGADQIADRLQKLLPPPLQENNGIPPEAQAAVAQAQQQMQAMQAQLQQLVFEKQAKVVEHQGKLQQIQLQNQADIALENRKLEVQITVAEIEAKSQIAQERAQFVDDMMKQFHMQAHQVGLQAHKQTHEKQMTQLTQAHEAALGAADAQQQSSMADKDAQNKSALASQQAGHQSAQSAQDAAQSQAAAEAQQQNEPAD